MVQRRPPADGAEVRRSADLERNAYEGQVCKVVYLRRDVNDRRSCPRNIGRSFGGHNDFWGLNITREHTLFPRRRGMWLSSLGSISTRVCCRIFTTTGLGRAGGLRVFLCLRGGIFIATCPSAYGWLRGRDNFSLVLLVLSPRIAGGIAVISLRPRYSCSCSLSSSALFFICASWWWRM